MFGRRRLRSPDAESLSRSAVVNTGWDGYADGIGADYYAIFDEGPNSIVGDSLMAAETLDAPMRAQGYVPLTTTPNLPPLLSDGSAQRARPNVEALAEFTPIGAGEVWLHDIQPCEPSHTIEEMQLWQAGVGQLANNIALVYPAGTAVGSGTAQGSGVTQSPLDIVGSESIAYISPETGASDLSIPNPNFGWDF